MNRTASGCHENMDCVMARASLETPSVDAPSAEPAPTAAERSQSTSTLVGNAPLTISVPIGRRVMVVSELRLDTNPTEATKAVAVEVADALRDWNGSGVFVICGGLFTRTCGAASGPLQHGRTEVDSSKWVQEVLSTHVELRDAIATFTSPPDRRTLLIPSPAEARLFSEPAARAALHAFGIELAPSIHLLAATADGQRLIVLRAGTETPDSGSALPANGVCDQRPWLAGIDRLERPSRTERFVTSRLLYRRLGRYAWWLIVPVAIALVLRLPFVWSGLTHLFGNASGPRHALARAHAASWDTRLAVAAAVTLVLVLLLAALLGLLSRRVWVALGGERLPSPWRDPETLDEADADMTRELDEARSLIAEGAAGLIVGGFLRAELVHLGSGFFATPGGSTELVREHRGRLGLPPVFLPHLQAGFLELETGAGLHARLMLATADLPRSERRERWASADRVVKARKPVSDLHPAMVGSWPQGTSWPPPPDRNGEQRRTRRVRRIAAAAIFAAGLTDLIVAVTPPLHADLNRVTQYLPLGVAELAGALVALAGIGLMMLARGILRGQRRPWQVAVLLLAGSSILHLMRAVDVISVVLSLAVLLLLVVERRYFMGAIDRKATRSAALTVVLGAVIAITVATIAAEVAGGLRHQPLPSAPLVAAAAAERLVGLHTIALPDNIDDFVGPSMLAVGFALVVACIFLATRPVVDRGLSASWNPATRRAAEHRARDIVRRHGAASLDYFALRDDKRWFFYRDGLVAYAVYGGICLVSPDPIGPMQERAHIWQAFRQFADRHGWGVGVMAASEEWLPLYRDSGMHHVYIGDEALVDVQAFSLQGGKMKGLRQACTRLARYGYRVEFVDPITVDPDTATRVISLMKMMRRGDAERGFSMCLGRVFDQRDTGLLQTIVFGPDGAPVAMCQFVPAPGIGGYSLDLMRRDPGEHPNGLLDFALCSTIEHLRERGDAGLSLNFAAMRSILEGDQGSGVTQRVERWALRRMSDVLPIESLWRFNNKYGPSWIPRYILYDSPERFASVVAAIFRAESLSEVPVIGRFLNPASTADPSEAA